MHTRVMIMYTVQAASGYRATAVANSLSLYMSVTGHFFDSYQDSGLSLMHSGISSHTRTSFKFIPPSHNTASYYDNPIHGFCQ